MATETRPNQPDPEAGEEFSLEVQVTREMVDYYLIGINDRHEWYREDSPFGGAIAPATFAGMLGIRASAMRMWGGYTGAIFTEPARLAYMTETEMFDPIRVGERVRVVSRALGNSVNRGRTF